MLIVGHQQFLSRLPCPPPPFEVSSWAWGGVTWPKKHRKSLAPKKIFLQVYPGAAAVLVLPLCGAIPPPGEISRGWQGTETCCVRPGAYGVEEHYKDLLAVYEGKCLGHKAPIWVVAHSFGCLMAVRLAADASEGPAKLVLIAPPLPPLRTPWIMQLPAFGLGWLQRSLTEAFLALAFHPQTLTTNTALVEQERAAANANTPWIFKSFYQSFAASEWLQDIDILFAIPPAVLVVCGDGDRVTPGSRAVSDRMTNARLRVVEGAGHQVMQERPDAVNALLEEYFFGDPAACS